VDHLKPSVFLLGQIVAFSRRSASRDSGTRHQLLVLERSSVVDARACTLPIGSSGHGCPASGKVGVLLFA